MPGSPSPLLPLGTDSAPRLHPAAASVLDSDAPSDGHEEQKSSSSPCNTPLVGSSADSPAPSLTAPVSARTDKAHLLERRRKRELASLAFSNPGKGFSVDDIATDDHSSSDTARRSSRRRSSARNPSQFLSSAGTAATRGLSVATSFAPSVVGTTRSDASSTPPPPTAHPSKRHRSSTSDHRKIRDFERNTSLGSPPPQAYDKGKRRAKDSDPTATASATLAAQKLKSRRKSTPAAAPRSVPRRRSGPTPRVGGPSAPPRNSSSLTPPPTPLVVEISTAGRKRPLSPTAADDVYAADTIAARPSSFLLPGSIEADALVAWYLRRLDIIPASDWRPMSPAHLPREYAALMEARSTWAQASAVGRTDTLSLRIPLDLLRGPAPLLPAEPDADTVKARLQALWDRTCYLEDDKPDLSPSEAKELATHQGRVLSRIDQLRDQGTLLADHLPMPSVLAERRESAAMYPSIQPSISTGVTDANVGASSGPATTPAPDADVFATYLQALAPPPLQPESQTVWGQLVGAIPARAKAMVATMDVRARGTRKVAKMVTQHWERIAARGERERKAEDRRVRALARWTSREVMKQWRLAITVVRKRKTDLARAADEQRGREQLSHILQQSTRMLERRQRGITHGHTTEYKYDLAQVPEEADENLDPSEEADEDSELNEEADEDSELNEEADEELKFAQGTDERDASDLPITDLDTNEEDISETCTNHDVAGGAVASQSLLVNLYTQDLPSPPCLASESEEAEENESEVTHAVARMPMSASRTFPLEAPGASCSLSSRDSHRDDAASEKDIDMDDENVGDESEDGDLLAAADAPLDELLKEYPGYTPENWLSQILPAASTQKGPINDLLGTYEEEDKVAASSPLTPLSAEAQVRVARRDDAVDGFVSEEGEAEEDESDEDAGLLADADLPIEELLRRYHRPFDDEELNPVSEPHIVPKAPYSNGKAQKPSLTRDLLAPDPSPEIKLLAQPDSHLEAEAIQNERFSAFRKPAQQHFTKTLVEEISSDEEKEQTTNQAALSPGRKPPSPNTPCEETEDVHGCPEPHIRPPFLLRGTLRPYQQTGLEWLADLYSNNMNGILADEMGLGKTIQTIALLAHLACDRGIWGPHLVVAPTSVMLNWEMEFKKFLPGFKILSYYGNQRERKEKRIGWQKENAFNVCITSYQLVLADQHIFRRKAWMYLILDEAHHIKNFRAKRWQTLLGFHSQRRLLLTGTPLQNNLMDLWSLMYFLMPHGVDEAGGGGGAFASIKDFQDWFANPLDKAIQSGDGMDDQTRDMVSKLHTVLRPFILRRLKSEVERELPHKYEHVITCRLSKRQRFLYNDFMSRAATRQSLASGNYLSIINCLMQLRKVCNHPDLFEVRPIVTAFAMERAVPADYEIKELIVRRAILAEHDAHTLSERAQAFDLGFTHPRDQAVVEALHQLDPSSTHAKSGSAVPPAVPPDTSSIAAYRESLSAYNDAMHAQRWTRHHALNAARCNSTPPSYSNELINTVRSCGESSRLVPLTVAAKQRTSYLGRCDAALEAIQPYDERMRQGSDVINRFAFVAPAVYAPRMAELALPGVDPLAYPELRERERDIFHEAAAKLQVSFPDASLLQYDCGKLQQLDRLMRQLKGGGHRILIFTQMTKVLDILESFLSFHGYRYLRLDGATKVENRPLLTERFNRDPRIMAFILSTRSGGLGINLTGADTVLFYDLDWNAAIEQQCMDRAHRIGQTRDVHIYRFVSEHTIEENMLKKANQKRVLDSVVIQQGEFSADSLLRSDWRDMLDDGGQSLAGVHIGDENAESGRDVERAMLAAEDEEDRAAAHAARQEMMVDLSDWGADGTARERGAPMHEEVRATVGPGAPSGPDDDGADNAPGPDAEEAEDDDEGTVDDYMLRWVEVDWPYFSNI